MAHHFSYLQWTQRCYPCTPLASAATLFCSPLLTAFTTSVFCASKVSTGSRFGFLLLDAETTSEQSHTEIRALKLWHLLHVFRVACLFKLFLFWSCKRVLFPPSLAVSGELWISRFFPLLAGNLKSCEERFLTSFFVAHLVPLKSLLTQ